MIKWILLVAFLWTVASFVLLARIEKGRPSPWWHWVVGFPITVIAFAFSVFHWFKMRFGKTIPPVVVIDDEVYTGDYGKYRQIRFTSEQNIHWTINIYSDTAQKVKMFNSKGESYES